MEIASFIVSFVGLIISIFAWIKAKNAKQQIAKVFSRQHLHEDIERLGKILEEFNGMKDEARFWTGGGSQTRRAGKREAQALEMLDTLVDQIRAKGPIDLGEGVRAHLEGVATRLNESLVKIRSEGSDDVEWGCVVAECHASIPYLESELRSLRRSSVSE